MTGEARFGFTDLGNAERLVYRHGDQFRHCVASGSDYVWDSTRWAVDETGELLRLAKETVRAIYEAVDACSGGDVNRSVEFRKHAIRSQAAARIFAMTTLARTEEWISVRPDQLDAEPDLFNVNNGTVDLRMGGLIPHDRENLITKLAPVRFDRNASCELWEHFVYKVMGRRTKLVRFLQRAFGYSLTAEVSEQVIFLLLGAGANGKSVLLSTLLSLVGDYGRQAAPGLLTVKYGEQHPTELADLMGARVVTSIEVEEGRRLAEALVKHLTGGDKIKARRMRQDFFEFEPTHKLWLAANHKPPIVGTDHAIWRRVRLIPFDVVIPDDKQDKELAAKLREELPGILNWAIEGCLQWRRKGLQSPDEVVFATADYRAEQDSLAEFIGDRCVTGAERKVSAQALYAVFRNWSEENGEGRTSQKWFGTKLRDRGFTSFRDTSTGRRWWAGIGLQPVPVFDLNDRTV